MTSPASTSRPARRARPGPGVLDAIARADVIVFCPSNPIVSIGPILEVPGIRDALLAARAPVVAISPIIGGVPVKGPADRLLRGLGHEVSARGVAALYGELLDGYVLDTRDAAQQRRRRGARRARARSRHADAQPRDRGRARAQRARPRARGRVIAAVVPVKALAESKSRLFPERARGDVEALSLAMMGDVIACLRAVAGVARVAVVTPDPEVAQAAEAQGAQALLRDDPGLNAAIEAASAEIAGPGDGVLVMLGDVAAADPEEVSQLLAAAPARGVVLAPSRDGGTSALLRRPRDVIPARFGRDSAKRHREAATDAGAPLVELALASLAIDVDRAEDAHAILAQPTLGARTRALLEAWRA